MGKHPACLFVDRGWVEITDNAAYRYITDPFVKKFLESDDYLRKINQYWVGAKPSNRMPRYDYDRKKISVCASYEVEKIEHVSHYPEWSSEQVIQALRLLCDMQIYCLARGFFIETHLWNFILRNGSPLLVDLGDFRPIVGDSSIPLQSVLGSFRDELDNHCPVHMSAFIHNFSNIKENLTKIQNDNQLSLVEKFSLFGDQFDKAESSTRDGYWSNYDKGSWKDIKDIPTAANNKSEVLCRYIVQHAPKTIFDIGCNTGMYSIYAASHGTKCAGVDTDKKSIAAANKSAKDRDLNCIFAVCDIMKPHPPWGLRGVYGSIEDRFKSEMVIAPAIFHHLLMQGYNSNLIIEKIASYSEKYLCLEYIPHHNSFSRSSRTWPTEEHVTNKLRQLGFEVSSLESYPPPRRWLMAKRREAEK